MDLSFQRTRGPWGDVNVTFARYDVMGALLQDTRRTWEDVESVLQARWKRWRNMLLVVSTKHI